MDHSQVCQWKPTEVSFLWFKKLIPLSLNQVSVLLTVRVDPSRVWNEDYHKTHDLMKTFYALDYPNILLCVTHLTFYIKLFPSIQLHYYAALPEQLDLSQVIKDCYLHDRNISVLKTFFLTFNHSLNWFCVMLDFPEKLMCVFISCVIMKINNKHWLFLVNLNTAFTLQNLT